MSNDKPTITYNQFITMRFLFFKAQRDEYKKIFKLPEAEFHKKCIKKEITQESIDAALPEFMRSDRQPNADNYNLVHDTKH